MDGNNNGFRSRMVVRTLLVLALASQVILVSSSMYVDCHRWRPAWQPKSEIPRLEAFVSMYWYYNTVLYVLQCSAVTTVIIPFSNDFRPWCRALSSCSMSSYQQQQYFVTVIIPFSNDFRPWCRALSSCSMSSYQQQQLLLVRRH